MVGEHADVFPSRIAGHISFGIIVRGTGVRTIHPSPGLGGLIVTLNCGHSKIIRPRTLFRDELHECAVCTYYPEAF